MKGRGLCRRGAESGWRTANTQSIQDEAAKRHIDLKFVDAQGVADNQKKAISSFIAQHVDVDHVLSAGDGRVDADFE